MNVKENKVVEIEEFMKVNYSKYLSYIASGRMCVGLDGMKAIHRRILFAALNICRNNNVKSMRLAGETTGKYSPHGDCYGSICTLVSNGFLIGKGSFDNNLGVENESAAAPRYTEIRLNPLAQTLFLNKDLLPYVDYIESELSTIEDKYYEPLYLPVLVPGVYSSLSDVAEFDSGMALKLSLKYPRYSIQSLINYIINYLKTGKFNPKLLYYQFHNIIKQAETDVLNEDRVKFKIPIEVDGVGNVHLLSTLPFTDMANVLKDVSFQDLTKMKTDIVIANRYYKTLKEAGKFETTVSFKAKAYEVTNGDYTNVVLHDYPIRYAIEVIIDRLKNILFPRYFASKISDIENKIKEYQFLYSIYLKHFQNKVPYEQMEEAEQASLGKHTATAFITSHKKIESLQEELEGYIKRSKNIDKEILDLYTAAATETDAYIKKIQKDDDVTFIDITEISK